MAKKRLSSRRSRSTVKPAPGLLNARPDPIDFRDLMFEPTLVEVPLYISLEEYRKRWRRTPLILDQGKEGACTGFGLAAVAHFLLNVRKVLPDRTRVSPRMFYTMARRYDEWPGEDYSGSSARGAMKGWHKHGVCSEAVWPYGKGSASGVLTHARELDAAGRPLGAYFRVNHLDLVAMHAAIAEVGILYATGTVHSGWYKIDPRTGVIPGPEGREVLGGHAFAIVGYDQRGFWIQNSWGDTWGKGGFALISYADWLTHGFDVWVARLGAPVELTKKGVVSVASSAAEMRVNYSFSDLRPHVIGTGNDGELRPTGESGTRPEDIVTLFGEDFPRMTKNWPTKRLLLYAHGGLNNEKEALQRVAEYRENLLKAEVYPLAFIWKTDLWSTFANMLKDAMSRRRPEGLLDAAKDFMLDRLDDTLELLTRIPGKAVWSEMKENAILSSRAPGGGAHLVLEQINQLLARDPSVEVHLAAHSAGSIFLGPIVKQLVAAGRAIKSCTLWAPACTMALFKAFYLPAIRSGAIEKFTLFTLKDGTERDDDCAHIYHKSLLYWVSNAFENQNHVPMVRGGEPLLGMEQFILGDVDFGVDASSVRQGNPPVVPLFGTGNADWVRAPNGLAEGSPDASEARHHGDFDDDRKTVKATLARILAAPVPTAPFHFNASKTTLAIRRRELESSLQR